MRGIVMGNLDAGYFLFSRELLGLGINYGSQISVISEVMLFDQSLVEKRGFVRR